MIKNKRKLGILGGTFDPPHNGHLKISTIAKKKYNLEFVIWAITKKNPFKKKSSINLKERIKYSKKFTEKKDFIKIKYFENIIKSDKTINLIKYILRKKKNYKIFFLMGADNLINLHKWYKWNEILKNCTVLVFDRAGYKIKSLKSVSYKKYGKKSLNFVKFNKVNISSSKLRKI